VREFGIMMKLTNFVRSLFASSSTLSDPSGADVNEKIVFSDRLYMSFYVDEIAVVSRALDNAQARKLSLDEAKQIFRSIKRACELQQTTTIKTAELSWKTDARLQPTWLRRIIPDRIVIGFDGPSGFVREFVRRDVVIAAIEEFTKKFCLADVKVSLERKDGEISNG